MTDITQHLPRQTQTVAAIYAHYKQVGDSEPPRCYLGASVIGHECERYLWYSFRHCCREECEGRMYRLFETGDLAEARFVADLRAIGCTVHEVDENGKQFAITAIGGHFGGHMDGAVLGLPEAPKTWHVTEFKTHNAKSFAKLQQDGVQRTKPQHYAQMQTYMHHTGMARAIYLAVNKDTEELYSERVHYDREFAEGLMQRAERVITSNTPPERIASRPDFYLCSWCSAKAICWGSPASALPVPAISCRQCCHATPTMDGHARWVCEKHGRSLSFGDQFRACEDHLVLPGLLDFAQPVDYGSTDGHDWVDYQNNSEAGALPSWRHGRGPVCYGTRELMALPAGLLSNGIVADAKQALGATVSGYCPDDILHRYPESESRIVWKGRASQLVEAWREAYGEDLRTLTPRYKTDAFEYRAAEYEGDRVAIFWPTTKEAEIREGVK